MTSKHTRILWIAALAILLLVVAVFAGTYWMVGPAVRCELPEQGVAEAGWAARTLVSGGLNAATTCTPRPGTTLFNHRRSCLASMASYPIRRARH